MTQVLANFIQVLRAASIRVSTAESIDAAAALRVVGWDHREQLRETLSQVLAKTPEDKRAFHDCFDRFFIFETPLAGVSAADPQTPEAGEGSAQGPAAEAGAGGSGVGGGGLAELLDNPDPSALQQAMASAARAVQLQNIRLFTQRGIYIRRLLEEMGIEDFDRALLAAARQTPGAPDIARRREQKDRLLEDVTALVDRQMLLYTANARTALREEVLQKTPLTRIEMSDFKTMQQLVRKLAKRLVALHSRRRRVAKRGQLDLRRTLRRNTGFDGLLFNTVWKQTKVDRPKIIAVCDVSGSVAQVSRFLLLFLYSMSEVLPKVRSFAFSTQLGEVTEWFQQKSAEEALALTMKTWGMGSTDYGGSLAELERLTESDLDHRTTVIVLGDARANYGDPGDRVLRRIHEKVRRVLWLNPEPRSFWNMGDSAMQKLATGCDRVESCRTLLQLERIINEIARGAG